MYSLFKTPFAGRLSYHHIPLCRFSLDPTFVDFLVFSKVQPRQFDRSLPSSWVRDDDEDCENVLFLPLDD